MKDQMKAVPEPDTEANLSAEEKPDATEYIEFVGDKPHGTEFYKVEGGTHSITAAHMKQYHDVELGAKEIVWRKKTEKGRMLVPVSDMTPEAAEIIAADPMFKRVTL